MAKSAEEIRTEVTKQIISALEAGTRPWCRPWVNNQNFGFPENFSNHRRYSGINPVILMYQSMSHGLGSKYWGTSSCWMKKLGVHVKQGEKCSHVILFSQIPKKDENGMLERTENGTIKTFPLMRQYPIFNADQMVAPSIELMMGVPGPRSILASLMDVDVKKSRKSPLTKDELLAIAKKYLPSSSQPDSEMSPLVIATKIHLGIAENLKKFKSGDVIANTEPDFAPAEALLKATKAKIKHGGTTACYMRSSDIIRMPPKRSFLTMTDYYQSVFHELAHWTEAEGRVGRCEEHTEAWGELVAEMSSYFTLMALGVPLAEKMLPKTQAYLASWLKAMGEDSKFLFKAAALASKVSDYLLTFVGQQNLPYEESLDDDLQKAA